MTDGPNAPLNYRSGADDAKDARLDVSPQMRSFTGAAIGGGIAFGTWTLTLEVVGRQISADREQLALGTALIALSGLLVAFAILIFSSILPTAETRPFLTGVAVGAILAVAALTISFCAI